MHYDKGGSYTLMVEYYCIVPAFPFSTRRAKRGRGYETMSVRMRAGVVLVVVVHNACLLLSRKRRDGGGGFAPVHEGW